MSTSSPPTTPRLDDGTSSSEEGEESLFVHESELIEGLPSNRPILIRQNALINGEEAKYTCKFNDQEFISSGLRINQEFRKIHKWVLHKLRNKMREMEFGEVISITIKKDEWIEFF